MKTHTCEVVFVCVCVLRDIYTNMNVKSMVKEPLAFRDVSLQR